MPFTSLVLSPGVLAAVPIVKCPKFSHRMLLWKLLQRHHRSHLQSSEDRKPGTSCLFPSRLAFLGLEYLMSLYFEASDMHETNTGTAYLDGNPVILVYWSQMNIYCNL